MSKKQDQFGVKVGLGLKRGILLLALALGMAAPFQLSVGMTVPDAPEAFRLVVPDAPDTVPDAPDAYRLVVPDGPDSVPDAFRMVVPDSPE